eukprot:tig00021348_g20533.t1
MSAGASEGRAIYRSLLRAVDRSLGPRKTNPMFREFLRAEFKAAAKETQPERVADLRKVAADYTLLVTSVKSHLDLLLDMGIGLDSETREKKRIERSAALVGLRLPEVAPFDERAK